MAYVELAWTAAAGHVVEKHWGVRLTGTPHRLHGGEESAAFAVGEYVVRLGPTWRANGEAEWCHGVGTHAAKHLVEAIAPCPAPDGSTVARVDGRPLSLWPLVDGQWAKPEAPGMMRQAAELLARLHRALAGLSLPPRPVPSGLEHGLDSRVEPPYPALVDADLDRWLVEYGRRHQARQLIHGDFYAGNTLARDGALVGLLDWDEACVAPPALEVASAALEWTDDERAAELSRLREFSRAYAEAGGTAGEVDEETLVQFIRHRIRCEARAFALAAENGVVHNDDDHAYHQQRLILFRDLRP